MSIEEALHIDPSAAVDSVIRIPRNTDALGRISAQTAKQSKLDNLTVGDRIRCVIRRSLLIP